MSRTSKITALYERLSRDDELPFWYKDGIKAFRG